MKSTLANSLILLVVASGTALLSFLDVTALGLAPLETMFLVFVAVMTPAMFLLGVGPIATWTKASVTELAVRRRWGLAGS